MGAGYGSGPERCRQAGQGIQERRQCELRDEHAAHEQRVRYSDVAQRGLTALQRKKRRPPGRLFVYLGLGQANYGSAKEAVAKGFHSAVRLLSGTHSLDMRWLPWWLFDRAYFA